jgi:hypothetical protein
LGHKFDNLYRQTTLVSEANCAGKETKMYSKARSRSGAFGDLISPQSRETIN